MVWSISVAVPVPPTICIVQRIVADGSAARRVSVIVGLAVCPVPLEVSVHSQARPMPTAAVTVALVPQPADRASSPLVQMAPESVSTLEAAMPESTLLPFASDLIKFPLVRVPADRTTAPLASGKVTVLFAVRDGTLTVKVPPLFAAPSCKLCVAMKVPETVVGPPAATVEGEVLPAKLVSTALVVVPGYIGLGSVRTAKQFVKLWQRYRL